MSNKDKYKETSLRLSVSRFLFVGGGSIEKPSYLSSHPLGSNNAGMKSRRNKGLHVPERDLTDQHFQKRSSSYPGT